MSETQETPETTGTPEAAENAQPDLTALETAFIVMKRHDGSWVVTSDVTQPFSIDRVASRADVRIGVTEVKHLMSHQELASIVVAALKASEENS